MSTASLLHEPPSWARGLRRHVVPYLLMAPSVLLVGILLLYPLVDEAYLSLTHWNLLVEANPIYVGPSTYARLFNDPVFWGSLQRTVIWTLGTVAIEFVVGFPLALALNHRTRLTGLAIGLTLLPWVTPTVVVSYAWVWVLDSQVGIVDAVLRGLHLVGSVSPLATYGGALPAVTVASGWKGTPFMAILLLAALKSIPSELYESAQIDGASWLERHRYITLPAVRKTALVAAMLLSIWAFYSFDYAWLMTQGGPDDATELASIYLFKTFQYALNWGYAAQIGVAMFVILVAAVTVYLAVAQPYRE
jgi:multiple sugar transport system permease protein